jgi:hypothetical protein
MTYAAGYELPIGRLSAARRRTPVCSERMALLAMTAPDARDKICAWLTTIRE